MQCLVKKSGLQGQVFSKALKCRFFSSPYIIVELFVTELIMVIPHHKPECPAKAWCAVFKVKFAVRFSIIITRI